MLKLTTARTTGLLYLGLAITGALSFLFVRDSLYVAGDAAATAANLVDSESLARLGLAAELALVIFQVLAAVWFYKLFKKRDAFQAGLIALFGSINAIAILVASAFWLSALNAALAGQANTALTLFDLHENIWIVANMFFGLWLIPMGMLVRASRMPSTLAWFLIAGGVGYVLASFVIVMTSADNALAAILPLPATVGEFWMIGYLLFKPVKTA